MLLQKLRQYVDRFNACDDQRVVNSINNDGAAEWLAENVPLIDCPDKTIEEVYYFRWWVFRKHIKWTEDGWVITEFLPQVPWSGKHNAIVAPFGHQISEAKWLKCAKTLITDYAQYYLNGAGRLFSYSTWFADSVYEYCEHCNDVAFGIQSLDRLMAYYDEYERKQLTDTGLYFSYDGKDAMECSISGGRSEEIPAFPGLRPTMNSYMAANAFAIAKIADRAGRKDVAETYRKKGEALVSKMLELLWDGAFFKAVHSTDNKTYPALQDLSPERNVRELLGYIPWMFNLPPQGYESAFADLLCTDGFASEYGLTTAEQRHPRYLYAYAHSCLWNGYIWPFATTQTLVAVMNLLENYNQSVLSWQQYYDMLRTYANMHYHTLEDGKKICWIDEVKDPRTNQWSSRLVLESWGWLEQQGGFERGRDYNHSGFCNLVLRGVFGIHSEEGQLAVTPHIPEDWNYFMVENLWLDGECYRIIYDKTGEHYSMGKGLTIIRS